MVSILPRYYLSRRYGGDPPLPFNYTLAVTRRCNSRCLTCNIWRHPGAKDLEAAQWERIFQSMGHSPYWVTLSGGEPFLRGDLVDLYDALSDICQPKVVTIPTNSLTVGVADRVWEMCARQPHVKLIVNVSLDHWQSAADDTIRGVPGHHRKAVALVGELKALRRHNLTVGVHTVVSRYNAAEVPEILSRLTALEADQHIMEVAEHRVELGTMNDGITPQGLDPRSLAPLVRGSRLTAAFRRTYYGRMANNRDYPCYAGWASVQVNANGDVWPCCIKGEVVGNVVDAGYDFHAVWTGEAMREARARIRDKSCMCPLANVSYTNMLLHPPSMARVGLNWLR